MNDIKEQEILDQVQKEIGLCDRISALAEKYVLAEKKSKGFLGLKKESVLDKPILNGDQEFHDLVKDCSAQELRLAKSLFQIELDELKEDKLQFNFVEGFACGVFACYTIASNNVYLLSIGAFVFIAAYVIYRIRANSRFKQRGIAAQARSICGMAETFQEPK